MFQQSKAVRVITTSINSEYCNQQLSHSNYCNQHEPNFEDSNQQLPQNVN